MRSIWKTPDGTPLRDVAMVCFAVGVTAMSYGAIAVATGFPPWLPVVMGSLVLAGASEFLFIGIVGAGGSPVAAVAAGLLVNARHVPFGLALPDVLGTGWRRALGSHLLNDESLVFAISQPDLPRKRAAYWACGLGIVISWPAGALLGTVIGSAVHDTDAFGLDAMFPAVLLALVLPALRDAEKRRAAAVGTIVALAAAAFLPAGLPVLLALVGLVTVTARRRKAAS